MKKEDIEVIVSFANENSLILAPQEILLQLPEGSIQVINSNPMDFTYESFVAFMRANYPNEFFVEVDRSPEDNVKKSEPQNPGGFLDLMSLARPFSNPVDQSTLMMRVEALEARLSALEIKLEDEIDP